MSAASNGKTIFMTGASGYIGSVITELAIAQGYKVRGLSRSEKGDAKLQALGAVPIRGDLHTYDVLTAESAQADIVMHLADAFLDHNNPKQYDEVIRIDGAAIDAMAAGLKNTGKPLVTSSGTLLVKADPNGGDTNEESPLDPDLFIPRAKSETYALSKVKEGVKVMNIRLPPYVYGRGGSGTYLFMGMAHNNKKAVYVNDGQYWTSTVHVVDCARLYLLVAEHGNAGDIFNCTATPFITQRQLTEAMAAAVNVPTVSITEEKAAEMFGPFLSKFLTAVSRASSAKAAERLGWHPTEPSLLDDIANGSYKRAALELTSKSDQDAVWSFGKFGK